MRRLLGIALVCVTACDSSKQPPPPVRPSGPPVVTDTIQIATLYSQNEVAADLKYKGKLVRLKGWVGGVTKNRSGSVVLTVASSAPGIQPSLVELLPGEEAKAASLGHMLPVEVEAIGDGHYLNNPTLVGGRILP